MNEQHGPITGIDTWRSIPIADEYERRYQHAREVHVCVAGWVCEAHPDQGSPHYTFIEALCGGARMPCPFHGCPRSVGAEPH